VTGISAFTQFDAIYNILLIVTVVTLLTWKLKFPSTLALILAGILSTFSTRIVLPDIGPEAFISLLLPPILFQETLHLDISGFLDEADSILFFAFLGTLIMQLAVALFTWSVLGLSIIESMLLGIIVAPTDPVAVIRTFHNLGVNKRFQIIVSGESLLNDGIAIVIYSILLAVITIGNVSFSEIGSIIFLRLFGGILIGIISGYLVHFVFCWTDDKFAEVLISFIAAFGVFRFAEELHTSGVLAIVITGLIINYRSRNYGGLGEGPFEMLEALWEFIAFLASSVAFIFIGMNLNQNLFLNNLVQSLLLLSFVILYRFLMVDGISLLIQKIRGKTFNRVWRNALTWSGLRGAVSIVLVFGVSGLVSNAELMIALTFGVVILSNVIQGITISKAFTDQSLQASQNEIESESSTFETQLMRDEYNSEGYNVGKNSLEKILFSSPEYFIYETRFGVWLANRLFSILSILNRYTLDRISKPTSGNIRNLIESITDLLSNSLNWINHQRSRRQIERNKNK
jgi:CPA1 family monovalent cation:H+ antiporter